MFKVWLKRFGAVLANGLVLYLLLNELLGSPTYSEKEVDTAIGMAIENARAERYGPALQQLQALTELAGEYPQVWYNYLTVLSWDDQKAKAVEILEDMDISEAPEYFLSEMIDAALAQERYDLLPKLAHAAKLNSENPELVGSQLITELLNREQFESAVSIAHLFAEHFPDSSQIQLLLAKALAPNDPIESAKTLERLLASAPSIQEARDLWAAHLVQFARDGDLDTTVEDFTQFYQQNPEAKAIAGELLILQNWNENDAAVIALWPELEQEPTLAVKGAAAQSFRRAGDLEKARQLYNELVAAAPDNSDYLLGSALTELELNNPELAAQRLAKIEPGSVAEADLLEAKAMAAGAQGQHLAAVKLYQQLIDLKPVTQRPYTAWFDQLAQLSQQQGWPTAEPHFEQTVAAAPLGIQYEAAALLMKLRQSIAANRLIGQLPFAALDKEQLESLAKLSRDAGETETAQMLYQAALDKKPDSLQLRLGQALVNIDQGNREPAWQQLETIEDQFPNNAQVLEALVYFHRRFGNHEEVLYTLERLAERSDNPDPYLRSWGQQQLSYHDASKPSDQLIDEFERMHMRFPFSDALRYDTLSLLHRAGHYGKALEIGNSAHLASAPPYVLEVLGQSARELQRYDQAYQIFTLGDERFPERSIFPISQALISVDKNQPDEALATLAEHRSQFGEERDFLLAKAYAYEQKKEYLPALAAYQAIIGDDPQPNSIYRSWVMAINYSGAPRLALEKAKVHREVFKAEDWIRLYADHAAIAVREGSFNDLEPSDRRQRATQALGLVREYQDYLQKHSPEDSAAIALADYDEILALHSAGQFEEAIAEFEQRPEPLNAPDYVLKVVGDTYLRLNQARLAEPLLEEVTQRKPKDHNANMMLFYAQVETEQYDAAQQTINKTIDNQPVWRRNGRITRDNPQRLAAERVGNLLKAYRNKLDEAQAQLEDWLDFAPANTTLRSDLARVYRWRGWPERAMQQYQLIAPVAPDDFQFQLGSAQTLMALNDFKAVDDRLSILAQDHPEDTGVSALLNDWEIYQSREFITQISRGFGDSDVQGGDAFSWQSWLFDKPRGYNWRPFLHHQYNEAEFTEGKGRVERLGAGIEYHSTDWLAQLEVHQGLRGFGETGARLGLTHFANDHWQFSGELQHVSNLVPVRAYNADIDGDSAELSAQYRWHQGRQASANLQVVDFSDDNRRLALSLSHTHTLMQNERHRLSLTESAYTSKNSEQGAAYYNPERDFSLGFSLEYEGLIKRYYDNLLSHRVVAGLGNYNQESFGSDFTWDLEYEQRWQRDKAFSINYGARIGQRVYDGESELLKSIFAGMNWRF